MSSNLFEIAKIMTNKAKGKNSISKDEFERVKKKFSLLAKDLPKVVNSNNPNKQEMIDNILTIEFDRDLELFVTIGSDFNDKKSKNRACASLIIQKVLDYSPRNAKAWYELAKMQFDDEQYNESQKSVDRAIELDNSLNDAKKLSKKIQKTLD